MSLLEDIRERHARFHAEINRRAALIPQCEGRTYSIPNAPFGVKKVLPKPVKPLRESDYWHCMWMFDLILDHAAVTEPITIRSIQLAICRDFDVPLVGILSKRRTQNIVVPRQIAMFLCKHLTSRTLPEIGRRFGGRDHTTVLHATRKIEYLITRDNDLKSRIAALAASIGGRL